MTKEKILKSEILKDEQLDNISGGILVRQAHGLLEEAVAVKNFDFIAVDQFGRRQHIARKF